MEQRYPILVIDYGTAATRALVATSHGQQTVTFDGQPSLPSGVYVHDDRRLDTGTTALMLAIHHPSRYIPAPKRLIAAGTDTVTVGESTVEVVDLAAATLRHVHHQATTITGTPPHRTILLIPPHWGPLRSTQLRRAARRAGLDPVTVLDTATATLTHPAAPGTGPVLVCDLGATTTITVLRPNTDGHYEVISPLHTDAGGNDLDHAIAHHLTTTDTTPNPATLATARTLKEALSHTPAAAINGDSDQPARIVTAQELADLAGPVIQQILDLAQRALTAADLTPEHVTAVHAIGGTAHLTAITDALHHDLGRPVTTAPDPERVALRGALTATGTTPSRSTAELPALRRLAGLLIPGLASLILLVHVYDTAYVDHEGGYTLITWGELALAAVFAQITTLTAATLIIDTIPHHDPPATRATLPFAARALATATAAGIAIAALYALTGSLYFAMPTAGYLRWSLLPGLGITLAGLTAAYLALTASDLHGRWHTHLAFPHSSTITATAGMILLEISITTPISPHGHLLLATGRLGGALIGTATALAIADTPLWRILTATPLFIFGATVAGIPATGYLAIIYTTTAGIWWLRKVTHLYLHRQGHTEQGPAGRSAAVPVTSGPNPSVPQPRHDEPEAAGAEHL